MSIALLSAAWNLPIGSTEKMVLMCLCDHANDAGTCWPSVATICRKTSKGERTVQSALRWLEDTGYFERDMRNGTSPVYHLDPRKICTPAEIAPPQKLREPPQKLRPTPAKSAPKPSMNHQEPSETKTKRAHIIPEGWQPVPFAGGSKCGAVMAEWPPGEFEIQVEHFTAHHRGKGSRFMNWQDAWKTWVLNSRKWNNGGRHHGKQLSQAPRTGGGIAAALDRRLGLGDPAGTVGRSDVGAGGQHRALPAPSADPVR